MTVANASRLDQAFDRVHAYAQRGVALDAKFHEWIQNADDDALNRINAHTLAALWNVDAQAVLVWLLYASQVGLFDLNWESHCVHCDGLTNMSTRPGALGHESSCDMCQVGFTIHSDQNVEVTFTINPAIRATEPSIHVMMPHGVVLLGKWETSQPITLTMDKPGQYFLAYFTPDDAMIATRFDVEAGLPSLETLDVTFYPESAAPARTALGPGTTKITVKGAPEVTGLYRDTTQSPFPPHRITGLDVMMTPEFKDVFAHNTLSQRESLSVKSLTILFTDITGSTAMYRRLGDVRAYNLVRDHFDLLFAEIEKYHGLVVKTIGDSVMAAFISPDDALKAALAVQRSIAQFNETRTTEDGLILVKIGLHTGSAIAVNLNNTLDYFGNMVNLAARIQSKSRSEEVLMSEQSHQDTHVLDILTNTPGLVVTDSMFELHGIGEQRLFSVMIV